MSIPRCQVIPLPDQQASFLVDGVEQTRWHFGPQHKGPFFYPLLGPSGQPLTRMGHPGAEDHDHHRSVWFAHNKVLGIDFWSMNMPGAVRQQRWYEYRDDDDECGMAVSLGWQDGHDPRPLLEQELIVFLRPLAEGEYTLDLHSTFRPTAAELEIQQSNYGFFAVRVAKTISARFGGGHLSASSGAQGEAALLGKPQLWMDYSGPVAVPAPSSGREEPTEGITYFDHPGNPGHPAKWLIRDDGWMNAAASADGPLIIRREQPLVLRYLLHVHRGEVQPERAAQLAADWYRQPGYRVVKPVKKHVQWEIERTAT